MLEFFTLYMILYLDLLLMQGKGRHIQDSPSMYISTLYLFFERDQSYIWGQETAYIAIKTCHQSLMLMFFKAHFKDNQTSKTCFLCLHHLNTINQNDQSLKNEI